jgi:biopolymer transport protein ExbB
MRNKLLKVTLIILSCLVSFLIYEKDTFIHRGGLVMIPMIFSSIFAFAIIVSKARQFFENSMDAGKFMKDIFERIERQRIKEALDLCDRFRAPLAHVVRAGLMKYDRPKDEIKEAMEASYLCEAPVLEENLSILSAIVQIAPLLGFLGTLIGLMGIFQVVEAKGIASLSVTAADLAPGIWQALICSVSGFLIAIPVFMAHNYLLSRIRSLMDEMELAATELLGFLMERRVSP